MTTDEDELQSLDLSSIGQALDWSQEEFPREKRKKKSVIRLPALDYQLRLDYQVGMACKSPASQSTTQRFGGVNTPNKM